ncbi:hypothetical protein WN943_012780 [Citrus x changshan-huyou]
MLKLTENRFEFLRGLKNEGKIPLLSYLAATLLFGIGEDQTVVILGCNAWPRPVNSKGQIKFLHIFVNL